MSDLQKAYDQTDFEMVQQTENLELPVSTAAVFEYEHSDVVSNSDQLKDAITSGEFALIAPNARDSPAGNAFLSSKVYAAETNEFLHVKLGSTTARIFPKDKELSFDRGP